jgi:hypothetical protein
MISGTEEHTHSSVSPFWDKAARVYVNKIARTNRQLELCTPMLESHHIDRDCHFVALRHRDLSDSVQKLSIY